MADWSKWELTDPYTGIRTQDDDKDKDAVRLNDTRVTSASNLPDYAKRWNATLGTFQNWLSSVWADIVLAVAGGGTGAITAAGARSNLGVPSVSEAQTTAQGLVDTHAALTSPHGAVSTATANKLALRDGAGRMQAADPDANADVATKQWVITNAGTSGTYTPTLTNINNITSFYLEAPWNYIRVGNMVFVTGHIWVQLTSYPGGFTFRASLPIASNITGSGQISGLCNMVGATEVSGEIIGVPASDLLQMAHGTYPSSTANGSIVFSYPVQ